MHFFSADLSTMTLHCILCHPEIGLITKILEMLPGHIAMALWYDGRRMTGYGTADKTSLEG